MKKLLSILLIGSFLAGTAGIKSLFAEEKKPRVIRLGNAFTGGYGKPFAGGTLGVVHQKGLLEEEFKNDGIKIEWNFFKGISAAANEALANDTIDFVATSELGSVIARAAGIKFKLIAAGGQPRGGGIYVAVPYDSTITSVKELKGKKVATSNASNFQLVLERLLQLNGLTVKDLQYYNLGPADGVASLASKNIDAALYGSQLFAARRLGLAKILYSVKDDKNFPDKWKAASGFFVTEKFAKEYPDIVRRIVKVYVGTAKWGSEEENREAWFQHGSKVGTPIGDIRETSEGVPLKLSISPLLDEFLIGHFKDTIDFAKERGLIRKTFDIESFVDRSYLDSALKETGLERYWNAYNSEGDKEIDYWK